MAISRRNAAGKRQADRLQARYEARQRIEYEKADTHAAIAAAKASSAGMRAALDYRKLNKEQRAAARQNYRGGMHATSAVEHARSVGSAARADAALARINKADARYSTVAPKPGLHPDFREPQFGSEAEHKAAKYDAEASIRREVKRAMQEGGFSKGKSFLEIVNKPGRLAEIKAKQIADLKRPIGDALDKANVSARVNEGLRLSAKRGEFGKAHPGYKGGVEKRLASINKRRATQGKRPLGGGVVGDKPGHPFRGNQYS